MHRLEQTGVRSSDSRSPVRFPNMRAFSAFPTWRCWTATSRCRPPRPRAPRPSTPSLWFRLWLEAELLDGLELCGASRTRTTSSLKYSSCARCPSCRAAGGGEEKYASFSAARQKLAGWPVNFPSRDRNRLAGSQRPISIATPLTVLVHNCQEKSTGPNT